MGVVWSTYEEMAKEEEEGGAAVASDWERRLFELQAFLGENNRSPSKTSAATEEKELGSWVSDQLIHRTRYEASGPMKDEETRAMWDATFASFPDGEFVVWRRRAKQVQQFLVKHGRLPEPFVYRMHQCNTPYEEFELETWLTEQHRDRSATPPGNAMRDPTIRAEWDASFASLPSVDPAAWRVFLGRVRKLSHAPKCRSGSGELGRWVGQQEHDREQVRPQRAMRDLSLRAEWDAYVEEGHLIAQK
jgi:hypothetical protein